VKGASASERSFLFSKSAQFYSFTPGKATANFSSGVNAVNSSILMSYYSFSSIDYFLKGKSELLFWIN
jgi:hypothetical protein